MSAMGPVRLHTAARLGQCSKIKRFLAAGDGVDSVDEFGQTPLAVAAFAGQVAAAQMLLAKGADPSACDGRGWSPLSIVADGGNIQLARLLIEAGAELNAIFSEGEGKKTGTPLYAAVFNKDEEMARLLIDAGCDVDKCSADWWPPLFTATARGHAEIFNMLIDAGANVNNANSRRGIAPLHAAVDNRSRAMVVRLLESGALVDLCDVDGVASLYRAAMDGSIEMVKILLENGADPNKKEILNMNTPLHTSCEKGHDKCVYALLCAKADVSASDSQDCTPLHHASNGGHTEIIELLLSAGAEICVAENQGRTPLVLASIHGHLKAATLLLEAGAAPNFRDVKGRNAMFGVSNLEVFKLLLSWGASVKFINDEEHTPLHYGGLFGFNAPVLCALYKEGVDPTLRDNMGKTAADLAREGGHENAAKMIDLLIAKHEALTQNTPTACVTDA